MSRTLMNIGRRIVCRFGWHTRLSTIQAFKGHPSSHVGCPDCGAEFGMNDATKSFLPWDRDFETMYESFGFDVASARKAWRERNWP